MPVLQIQILPNTPQNPQILGIWKFFQYLRIPNVKPWSPGTQMRYLSFLQSSGETNLRENLYTFVPNCFIRPHNSIQLMYDLSVLFLVTLRNSNHHSLFILNSSLTLVTSVLFMIKIMHHQNYELNIMDFADNFRTKPFL